MITQPKYEIPFTGLPMGQSVMEFDFDSSLFALYPESGVENGAGRVTLDIIKHAAMLEVTASIKGKIKIECDRCADFYEQPLDFSVSVIVKKSREQGQYDGDIIWADTRATSIDIGEWLYESIILALPLQRIHQERNECNAEALKYIQSE